MSRAKRDLFSEIYELQDDVLELIDKPIKVADLKEVAIGLVGEFNFKIVATNFNGINYKCLCPQCNEWVEEWSNWYEAKEFDDELKAKCKCGCITPRGELICEAIKK